MRYFITVSAFFLFIGMPGFGQEATPTPDIDLNGDNEITVEDFYLFILQWKSTLEEATPTPTPEATATETPGSGGQPFNIRDYFILSPGSSWHYTGAIGGKGTTEDDFGWMVEETLQDVGGGKMANRIRTTADDPEDGRHLDVDFWAIEEPGKLVGPGDLLFYGISEAVGFSVGGVATVGPQDFILEEPVRVGSDGLLIGDELMAMATLSIDAETLFGPQTFSATANAEIRYTDRVPILETALGTFTDVIRLEIEIMIAVNVGFIFNFPFIENTVFLKEGVGVIAIDLDIDPGDEQLLTIDQGTVVIGGVPTEIVAQ